MVRALLAALLLAAALSAQVGHWSAHLDGEHVVPPTVSPGTAWGLAEFDAATRRAQFFCALRGNVAPVTSVAVREAAVGSNGPLVVALTPVGADSWRGTAVLTPLQAAALGGEGLYLEVQTSANPAGALRGQFERPRTARFVAVLSGQQVAPPTSTQAAGTCTAYLHEPENRLVYAIRTRGVTNWTAAHLHIGAAGTNGPIAASPTGQSELWRGVSDRLPDADVAALRSGRWYVDVHSVQFPNGELRGQLRADLGANWVADCGGAEETPPNASAARCTAELEVGPDDLVTLTGTYSGLAPISAHVHTGQAGVAGPILFNLTFQNGQLGGSHQATAADLANLRAGFWYVNVHSNAFPQGEIRGQLEQAPLPTSYGSGCTASNGSTPFADATDPASIGSLVHLQLGAAQGCPFALLCLGDDRSTGLPLALRALSLDAPDCFALTNVFATDLRLVDALGCADADLPVPFDAFLRGAPIHAQWLLLDPPANPAALVVSNAVTFPIL